jgi:hypothetical protein
MGYLKGQFQSLQGLRQDINSGCDFLLALTWVRVALVIHSLAFEVEHVLDGEDFWAWVAEGADGADNIAAEDGEIFHARDMVAIAGESGGQRKLRQVQQALFDSFDM